MGNQIDQQLTADMATIPLYAKPTYLAVRSNFAQHRRQRDPGGPVLELGPVGPEGHLTSLVTGRSRGKP